MTKWSPAAVSNSALLPPEYPGVRGPSNGTIDHTLQNHARRIRKDCLSAVFHHIGMELELVQPLEFGPLRQVRSKFRRLTVNFRSENSIDHERRWARRARGRLARGNGFECYLETGHNKLQSLGGQE